MSINDTNIRQSEADYRWAEHQRRQAEAEAARAVVDRLNLIATAARERATAFRDACDEAGVSPYVGDVGRVEQYLWGQRQAALREWDYARQVWWQRELARRAADDRYSEVA